MNPGRRLTTPRALISVLAAFAFVLLAPIQAEASFNGPVTSAGMSVGTATLNPPTLVASSNVDCGILFAANIKVTWTATSSAFASGYIITPYIGSTAQTPVTVTGQATNNIDVAATRGSTYSFKMVAVYLNWTSTIATSSGTTTCGLLG